MSTTPSTPTSTPPGIQGQRTARNVFRVAGVVVLVAALYFLVTGFHDLMTTDGEPTKFWMMFVGIFGLAVAGWCLQAGFMGAASRYVAGETMPTVKDSAAYLSDGEGVLGVGRTVDDAQKAQAVTGPYCSTCGTRNDADASFCDSCGAALAR
jgi:zinc ribbon protein